MSDLIKKGFERRLTFTEYLMYRLMGTYWEEDGKHCYNTTDVSVAIMFEEFLKQNEIPYIDEEYISNETSGMSFYTYTYRLDQKLDHGDEE